MPSSQAVAGGGRVTHDARWFPDEVVQTEHRIDSPGSYTHFTRQTSVTPVYRIRSDGRLYPGEVIDVTVIYSLKNILPNNAGIL